MKKLRMNPALINDGYWRVPTRGSLIRGASYGFQGDVLFLRLSLEIESFLERRSYLKPSIKRGIRRLDHEDT